MHPRSTARLGAHSFAFAAAFAAALPALAGAAAAQTRPGTTAVEVRPSPPAAGARGAIWAPTPGVDSVQRVWRGQPIDLSLKNADLREVLRSFAKLSGTNLILDPDVQGQVTVELHEVPWDQALYVILKTHGLAAEVDGRIWSVAPLPQLPRQAASRP